MERSYVTVALNPEDINSTEFVEKVKREMLLRVLDDLHKSVIFIGPKELTTKELEGGEPFYGMLAHIISEDA
jgi:hypothetical protein